MKYKIKQNTPAVKTKLTNGHTIRLPYQLTCDGKHLSHHRTRESAQIQAEKHWLKKILDAREMAQIEAKAQEEYYL